MNDNPKMWIGTPGEGDWREVGEVMDLDVGLKYDPPDIKDRGIFDAVTPIQDSYVVDLKLTSTVDTLLEMMRNIGEVNPFQEQLYRSVMVVGTRKLAHVHPGLWELRFRRGMPEYAATVYGATRRVEHTRARKLYSERLRRDRRRQRKGRKPILRSGPSVRALFPRVEVKNVARRGDGLGMRMITSPHLDSDQVAMFDTQLLDCTHREPLKVLDYDRPGLKDVARDYIQRTLPLYSDPFKIMKVDPS